jgi:hypothetical protein
MKAMTFIGEIEEMLLINLQSRSLILDKKFVKEIAMNLKQSPLYMLLLNLHGGNDRFFCRSEN